MKRKSSKQEQEMFTTTISLPLDVHRKLRHLALDKGKTLRDLIREAIDQYLEQGKGGVKK